MGLWPRIHHAVQGQGEQGARPRREPGRDARLQLSAAARDAAEGQARRRRRGHRQEAPAAADATSSSRASSSSTARPARRWRADREDLARTALERKVLIQGQLQDLDQQIAAARGPAAGAGRSGAGDVGEGRGLPHPEGGHQGAVLGRRGSGADRRGHHRTVRARCPTSVPRSQRAQDKTEQMQARAAAVEELVVDRRAGRPVARPARPTSTGRSPPCRPTPRSSRAGSPALRAGRAGRPRRASFPGGQADEPAAPEPTPETEAEHRE